MNIGVHVSCSITVYVFSGYTPRSGIAGSYDSSVFNFLRNLQSVLYNGCTSVHSQQQCGRVPFSSHPLQHLLFVYFLMIAIVTDVGGIYFIVVLICISLNNQQYLTSFHVLVSHLYVLFGKISIQVFCPFFNWICFNSSVFIKLDHTNQSWIQYSEVTTFPITMFFSTPCGVVMVEYSPLPFLPFSVLRILVGIQNRKKVPYQCLT